MISIIITYNPNYERVLNLVNELKKTNVDVIIVDNNSTNKCDLSLKNSNVDGIYVIALKDNLGIAYAQNVGIHKAIELGAEKIIFFDQDSHIDEGFIDNLLLDFDKVSAYNEKIAAVGPRFVDENKGFYFPALKFNKHGLIDKISVENINEPIKVSFLISSGTLVSVTALKDIGYMKEEFFIDYVDTEWCFRALAKGYRLYMSEKAIMKHSVGDDTIKLLNFKIPVHSGYRRYYRIRNLFFMWKMPYIPKILTAKLMMTNFAIQVLLLFLKDKKLDYIKYYLSAIRDGIKQSRNYHG